MRLSWKDVSPARLLPTSSPSAALSPQRSCASVLPPALRWLPPLTGWTPGGLWTLPCSHSSSALRRGVCLAHQVCVLPGSRNGTWAPIALGPTHQCTCRPAPAPDRPVLSVYLKVLSGASVVSVMPFPLSVYLKVLSGASVVSVMPFPLCFSSFAAMDGVPFMISEKFSCVPESVSFKHDRPPLLPHSPSPAPAGITAVLVFSPRWKLSPAAYSRAA